LLARRLEDLAHIRFFYMFSFHFEPDSVCMVMFSDDDKAALIKFWVTTPEGRAIFLSLIVLSIKYKREKSEANWRL